MDSKTLCHLKTLFCAVTPETVVGGYFGHQGGGVASGRCARTSRDVLVLLWCLYAYESTGNAVVLARNVFRFLMGDTEDGISLVGCWLQLSGDLISRVGEKNLTEHW